MSINQNTSLWDPATQPSAVNAWNGVPPFMESDPKTSAHAHKIAMYERAAQLPLLLTTWVLVADAWRAQLYERRHTTDQVTAGQPYDDRQTKSVFMPVKDGTIEMETIDDYHSEHYSYDAIHKYIREEMNQRFIKSVAHKLQHSLMHKMFDRLILVSPPKLIAELKEHLSENVQNCIAGILPRDFKQYQD